MRRRSFWIAAAVMATATTAFGDISLEITQAPIASNLASDGWIGLELSLVGSTPQDQVGGIDLKNYVTGVSYSSQPGITGIFYQSGSADTTAAVGKLPANTSHLQDSFFTANPSQYFFIANQFSEDNSGQEGATSGIGSQMTFCGVIQPVNTTPTLNLAFVIVKAGATNGSIQGAVLNTKGNEYVMNSPLAVGTYTLPTWDSLQPVAPAPVTSPTPAPTPTADATPTPSSTPTPTPTASPTPTSTPTPDPTSTSTTPTPAPTSTSAPISEPVSDPVVLPTDPQGGVSPDPTGNVTQSPVEVVSPSDPSPLDPVTLEPISERTIMPIAVYPPSYWLGSWWLGQLQILNFSSLVSSDLNTPDFMTASGDGNSMGSLAVTNDFSAVVPEPGCLSIVAAGVGLLGGRRGSRRV